MKETEKGTVKEAITIVAQLVHHGPIKPNGLSDYAFTGRADRQPGGTELC